MDETPVETDAFPTSVVVAIVLGACIALIAVVAAVFESLCNKGGKGGPQGPASPHSVETPTSASAEVAVTEDTVAPAEQAEADGDDSSDKA